MLTRFCLNNIPIFPCSHMNETDQKKEEIQRKKKLLKKSRNNLDRLYYLEKTNYLLTSLLYEEKVKRISLEKR